MAVHVPKPWSFLVIGCLSFILSGLLLVNHVITSLGQLTSGLLCALLALVGVVAVDFYRLLPSEADYTLGDAALLYAFNLAGRVAGHMNNHRLQRATRHVKEAQDATLTAILKANSNTAYGASLNVSRILTREELQKKVPLSKYPDVKPFIDKAVEGQERVFTRHKVIMFATSSGTTTGVRNLLPVTAKNSRALFSLLGPLFSRHIPDAYYPGGAQTRKILRFAFISELQKSPSGVPIGPMSTLFDSPLLWRLTTTPPEAYKIQDRKSFSYVNHLFALRDASLGKIYSPFAAFVLSEFDQLMEVWPDLVADLEAGTVSPKHVPDAEIRGELECKVQPNRQRARDVRREILKGRRGLARRLWPHCSHVSCITSGTMELYGAILRESYCQGLPIYSPFYSSSEAGIGVNLWPLKAEIQYLPLLTLTFMEFIPTDQSHAENPDTLFLDQLEYGKDYELVMTTAEGLWRYRNGDVIRVCGFHNECPILEFRYRMGQLLNIAQEHTTETAFYQALTTTLASMDDIALVDYTTTTSTLYRKPADKQGESSGLGNYEVFLELRVFGGKVPEPAILSSQLDLSLRQVAPDYDAGRQSLGLGRLAVHFVHPGTFSKFADFRCRDLTSAINQFKMSRNLVNESHVKFFIDSQL